MNNTHLTDFLRSHALSTPDKLALVTKERSITWQQLWQEVQAGAAILNKQMNNDEQRVIALLMPNSWQYVVAYLSVVHAGHMAMPIDIIFKPLEIERILKQVPPALIITDQDGLPRLGPTKIPVIDVADFHTTESVSATEFLRFRSDEQVASLFFTSGTTGRPKVVPNTHANHIWNIVACSKVWKWTGQDTQLVNVRLSHMLGLVMCMSGTLYHGCTMYLQDRFSVEETLEMLHGGQITMFSHGPVVYSQLLNAPGREKYDLAKVRLFISGSGPLPPNVWQEFKDVYGAEILEVYGSTETGRITSNLLDERIPGSPGRPLPEVSLKFSEDKEVLVKSPGVFPGYFNNPQATSESRTEDGYWRTGDIGELVSGRLVLKGRTQERIRKQGYTISPRDVEWALLQNKHIAEAYVMGQQIKGQPDDKIVYFLVSEEDDGALQKYFKEALPSVWRPDKVLKLDAIPRTINNKPNLPILRGML